MKKRDVQISASIMCMDWLDVGVQLKQLKECNIDFVHFDVVDGNFAPDFTMGSSIINKIRSSTSLPSDYHLMVEEPSRLFDSFEISNGDIFTIHQEGSRNLHRDLLRIRNKGGRVGVALNPATPIEALDYIIEDIDVILVMTVNPGYMGQSLVPQTLRKIEKISELIRNMKLDIKISVDGNVNYENIPDMVGAGADILVGGSSGLFRPDRSISEAVYLMKERIAEGFK
jgi:ribulose-phosphate 3-epimerase